MLALKINMLVDLVAHHQAIVVNGYLRNLRQFLIAQHATSGIVRRVD